MAAMTTTLFDIEAAVRAQDWRHVLELSHRLRSEASLGRAEEASLLIAEGDAFRARGDLVAARDRYLEVVGDRAERGDPRALHGLASCLHAVGGDNERALWLAEHVVARTMERPALWLRAQTLRARIIADEDIAHGVKILTGALSRSHPAGSARAHARFILGALHAQAGDIDLARRQLRVANADARALDAARTVADTICAEVGVSIIAGDRGRIAAAMGELLHAEQLLRGLDDRSIARVHLMRGAAYLHTAQYRMARAELGRASWLANEGHDQATNAHALLSLADLGRLTDNSDPEPLMRAQSIYRRANHTWGLFNSHILVALGARTAGRADTATRYFADATKIADAQSAALGLHDLVNLEGARSGNPSPLKLNFPL